MDSTSAWASGMLDTIGTQIRAGVDHLPTLLGAVALLIVGWILARLLRRATQGLVRGSNRLLDRFFNSGALRGMRISPVFATIVGEVVFWSVLLLAVTAASRVLGLGTVSLWLERIAIYLPNLIVAAVVVGVGYFLGVLVRQQLSADTGGVDGSAELLGRIAQALIVAIALVIGLAQLGVRAELLVALLVVVVGIGLGTVGVSIAWGTREYMRNVIGLRSVRGHLQPGMTITVDGVTGTIVETGDGIVTLETDHGKTLVPGRLVSEGITTIVSKAQSDGDER